MLGLPINVVRTYEDHVLGKLYADWSFGRAGDALRRYEGRDRARGLAFVLDRFRDRSGFDGVLFSPGVLKGLLEQPPEEVLQQGWESLRQDGPDELNERLYQSLIAAARRTAEVLGPDDVAAVEAGDALAEEGERLARRQVRQAAAALESALPRHRPRPPRGPRETPTRMLDDSAYPVGGFSSISTRGSVESLLHSQLAYMERDERPDLFDVKFLRDELLFYSRDENQFLRRRRTFVFALSDDLTATRFKDPELPYQRGVLLLALLTTAVKRLTEWLAADALAFEILFVGEGDAAPLAAERALLQTLLREPIVNGTVRLKRVSLDEVAWILTVPTGRRAQPVQRPDGRGRSAGPGGAGRGVSGAEDRRAAAGTRRRRRGRDGGAGGGARRLGGDAGAAAARVGVRALAALASTRHVASFAGAAVIGAAQE